MRGLLKVKERELPVSVPTVISVKPTGAVPPEASAVNSVQKVVTDYAPKVNADTDNSCLFKKEKSLA